MLKRWNYVLKGSRYGDDKLTTKKDGDIFFFVITFRFVVACASPWRIAVLSIVSAKNQLFQPQCCSLDYTKARYSVIIKRLHYVG